MKSATGILFLTLGLGWLFCAALGADNDEAAMRKKLAGRRSRRHASIGSTRATAGLVRPWEYTAASRTAG